MEGYNNRERKGGEGNIPSQGNARRERVWKGGIGGGGEGREEGRGLTVARTTIFPREKYCRSSERLDDLLRVLQMETHEQISDVPSHGINEYRNKNPFNKFLNPHNLVSSGTVCE